MRIPKQLKIGGHIYDIDYPYIFKEREDIFGRTNFSRNSIMISDCDGAGNECSKSHTERVFWHEVIHAVDIIYCCDGIGDKTDKESMIEGLAQGLYQVLVDNFKGLELLEEPADNGKKR